MERFTQKWAIVALLENVSEGSEFYLTNFPLHITLAGVFGIDHDGSWLEKGLAKSIVGQKSFLVTAKEKAMFGPDKNIAVMRIAETPEIIDLYSKIYNWLRESGANYNEPDYQGSKYIPHSTIQKSGSLKQGETRLIKSISIIDLYPNDNGHYRKIFKTLELE